MTTFEAYEPTKSYLTEYRILTYARKMCVSPTFFDVTDFGLDDIGHRGFNGFHLWSSSSFSKSDFRNCSRTCGDFEQIARNRHPPNLSQDVSFMGQ